MNALKILMLAIVVLGWSLPQVGGEESLVEVGKFSAAAPGVEFPDNWKPLTFKKVPRRTTYSLVRDGETVVLKAVSEAAASGLMRQISINPRDYPILRWRWKVTGLIQKTDVTRKGGDDYPARLYITFQYDSSKLGVFERAKYELARILYGDYPPLAALNYIWANREPKGTVVPNAYSDRARMIIVENGTSSVNTWVTEERNLLEDYRLAFGDSPEAIPMISGVAVMTDTDDTGESASALFGDIVFARPTFGMFPTLSAEESGSDLQ
jgi:hypothetical protein